MTLVILLDHDDGHRVEVMLGPDDHDRLDASWHAGDRLLTELQNNEFFAGRSNWCDLDPWHFTQLIERNLAKMTALSLIERGNPDHAVMRSMTFLLTGLVRCIEERCQSIVELLRVTRVHASAVTFDYTATMNHAVMSPRRPVGFKVVVNN